MNHDPVHPGNVTLRGYDVIPQSVVYYSLFYPEICSPLYHISFEYITIIDNKRANESWESESWRPERLFSVSQALHLFGLFYEEHLPLNDISTFFINSKKTMTPSKNNMPRVNITYSPTLVPELINEHHGMLKHLATLLASFERKELSTTVRLLEQFKNETVEHVYKETVKLYLYLQYALVDRPDEFAEMHRFRKGMDHIVADTMNFIEQYETLETDVQQQKSFKAEMETLRDRWLERVEVEEKALFPMYQPPVST